MDLSPDALIDANTLQGEGKRPFHLKVDFQIFDLQGAPYDTGTLEYWWAGPDGTHLDVTSPKLGTLHSLSSADIHSPIEVRTLYLLESLLHEIESPGALRTPSRLYESQGSVATENRKIQPLSLKCLSRSSSKEQAFEQAATICADTETGTFRIRHSGIEDVMRNRPARFGTTRVALDIAEAFGGRQALTAHIQQLQSFSPSSAGVTLDKPATDSPPVQAGSLRLPGAAAVMAGRKLGGPAPVYPVIARQNRLQGTVLLTGEITTEGKTSGLTAIASPDPSLTDAALEAVRKWTYQPYLLNGKPVTVTTNFTVNFQLNVR